MKRIVLLVCVGAALLGGPAVAQSPVRIATWNFANLYAVDGVPLRAGAAARYQADFARLSQYVALINADVVGLQEVNSPEAVYRVFDPSIYEVVIDGRRDADISDGLKPPAEGGAGANETDGIYVGLAVRRGRVTIISHRDIVELSVIHAVAGAPPRPTRRGLEALLEIDGRQLTVLVIHLKSGCATGSLLVLGNDPDCVTLALQVPVLAAWVADHAAEDFIIMGDWNRRIENFDATDHLWDPLDIGGNVLAPVDLARYPHRDSPLNDWLANSWVACPTSPQSRDGPIDYFAVAPSLNSSVRGWTHYEYTAADVIAARDPSGGTRLSDHCPSLIELMI